MPQPTRTPRAALRRAAFTFLVIGGVVGSSALAVSPAAAATPDDFSTSFESADQQPLVSTVATRDGADLQNNVRATGSDPGDFTKSVAEITASGDNPPNEVESKLADSDPSTKWLVKKNTGWAQYRFDEPHTVTSYSLTSANDSPTRDPQNWTLEGSTDGSNWTTIDTRSGASFAKRFQRESFTVDADKQAAYTYFRLDVTKNGGDGDVQLGDWNLLQKADANAPQQPMLTAVGNGPTSGYNIKSGVGFTGLKALEYSGEAIAKGEASETNVLYSGLHIAVGDDSRLEYKIFPELTNGDLQYPSTYTAVDLHFTDGTYLSDLGATDQHDYPLTAAGQGKSKILYAAQWNDVQASLGDVASGKTIDSILLSYDNPDATASTQFQGWIDDLTIDATTPKIDDSSLTNYVDTRRGTNASGSFSRGENLPFTAVPNGFNFYTPLTSSTSKDREYLYMQGNDNENLTVFQGLGISHEPSPWMGDRDQLSVMPSLSAQPSGDAGSRQLEFSHDDEIAHPDYYSVSLKDGIQAEMTPGDHSVVERYTFPSDNDSSSLVFDTPDDNNAGITMNDDGTFSGWVQNGNGWGQNPRMFVYGTFDRSPTGTGSVSGAGSQAKYATFDTSDTHTVTLRMSTSYLSLDQAKHNYGLELGDDSFEKVRSEAQSAWDKRLGAITVDGASQTQLVTLYSNLYRLNLYPNEQYENTGTASDPVYKYASPMISESGSDTATTTGSVIKTGKMYVNNGFWDTYRTVWPAYSLLYPKFAAQLVDGMVQQYRDGGWVARWTSPGYANMMTGTSSDVAFADAYLRGVPLTPAQAMDAFDAGLKNATVVSSDSTKGRNGLTTSAFLGYTSTATGQSVSWSMEGYINDFGLANMAAKLAADPAIQKAYPDRIQGLTNDAAYLMNRAQDYVNLFDPATGFFRGKDATGAFDAPASSFDPTAWGPDYTETNAYTDSLSVPQDVQGLANLILEGDQQRDPSTAPKNGKDALEQWLDSYLSTPEVAKNVGTGGGVIHENAEARDTRMGELGMSNQPAHAIPYFYDYTNDPSKTQSLVREIMQRLYIGDEIGQGYPGDEDNGEMSSWYVLSSLGIYPDAAGSSNWVIGSPLFSKETVKRDDGKTIVVNAQNNSSANVYVQSLKVNGVDHDSTSIDQSELTGSDTTTLDFTMGSQPSSWGSANPPTSLTTGDKPADPLADSAGSKYGTATSKDGEDTAVLFDNTSATQVTFASGTPQVTFAYSNAAQTVKQYTITSGTSAGDPTSWQLQGSNDGTTWTTVDERTNQTFGYRQQTEPFTVSTPGSFQEYRLNVTASTSATPSIAELELLADPQGTSGGAITVKAATGLTATAGTAATLSLGTVTGGVATDASGYTASVDWGDGTSSDDVTVAAQGFGTYALSSAHTFDKPGVYRVTITVGDGETQAIGTTDVTVSYVAADSLAGAFDRVCIGDDGVPGANCDGKNWSYSRQALAAAGVTAGKSVTVPGTDLSFALPVVAAGQPDNAIGAGQTIRLNLPADATQLSLIGSGTQGNQDTTGTLTFTDGTTASIPIQFTDWTMGAKPDGTPSYGNVTVAKSAYRLLSGAKDSAVPFLFATAPFAIPQGKTVASITLPDQSGTSETSDGRIHVFALATDGTQATPLTGTAGDDVTATAGTKADVTLGTVTGGDPIADGSYTARVQWGDSTQTEDAEVKVSDGVGTISGSHTWADAGDYTISVTAVDRDSSTEFTVKAHVKPTTPEYSPTLKVSGSSTVDPGDSVALTGTGFAPNEKVTVTLDTTPAVKVDVTADGNGEVQTSLVVPSSAAAGDHTITAIGATSGVPATAALTVSGSTPPAMYSPEVVLSTTAATVGQVVHVQGDGFAKGETVTMTLHSSPTALGTLKANAQGIVTGTFTVPAGATVGSHTVEFAGAVSKTPVTVPFVVLKPGAPASSVPSAAKAPLANTGLPYDVGGVALVAILALLAGAAAMTAVRRRKRRRAA
jgi:predicted alpha-1,2-mannosidase